GLTAALRGAGAGRNVGADATGGGATSGGCNMPVQPLSGASANRTRTVRSSDRSLRSVIKPDVRLHMCVAPLGHRMLPPGGDAFTGWAASRFLSARYYRVEKPVIIVREMPQPNVCSKPSRDRTWTRICEACAVAAG